MAHLKGLQENSSSLHVQQSQGFLRREAGGSLGVSEGQVSHRELGLVTGELWSRH